MLKSRTALTVLNFLFLVVFTGIPAHGVGEYKDKHHTPIQSRLCMDPTLTEEKKIFMASFSKAYEAIPLEALHTSAPDTETYLTRAFQPDVDDFWKKGFLAIDLLHPDGALVAYMSLDDVDQQTHKYPGLPQNSLYIRNLAVHPDEQGKGLGTLMVNKVLKGVYAP